MFRWWSRVVRARFSLSRRQRPGGRFRRLGLEPLEARCVPANVFWNVDADGAWEVASNWSTGTVPGANDDVFLDRPGGSFTITHATGSHSVHSLHAGSDALILSGGTLIVGADSEIDGGLTVSGNFTTLRLNGPLTLTGNTLWTGGTIQGQGGLSNSGTITLDGSQTKTLTSNLTNTGTIVETGTAGLNLGATLDNQAGGVYDLQTGNGAGVYGSTFLNEGTLLKSAGLPYSNVAGFSDRGGTIDVEAGQLRLSSATSQTGGTWVVAAGAGLDLSGLQDGNSFTGTYTGMGDGTVTFNLATLHVGAAGATFDFPPGMFQWQGGTLDGGTAGLTNVGSITLVGGEKVLAGVLNNAGTVTETGAYGDLRVNGTFNNEPGALYDLQSDAGLAGTGTFNNLGTFLKSGSTLLYATVPPLSNQGGTLDVESGQLRLGGAGKNQNGGVFDAGAGAVLDLTGGATTGTFSGTFTGSGDGQVLLSDGTLNAGPTGATFAFDPGLFRWTSGTLNGGSAGLTNTGGITLDGNVAKVLNGTLNNLGTIVHTGNGALWVSGTATLNNRAGAVYELQSDVNIVGNGSSTGQFNNVGTLLKSGGSGTSILAAVNLQGGTLDAESGILSLQSAGKTHTGGVLVAASGAAIDLTGGGGNNSFSGTYTGSGDGTVSLDRGFGGGTLRVATGGVTFDFPPGLFQWTAGTITSDIFDPPGLINLGSITLGANFQKTLSGDLDNYGSIVQTGIGDFVISTFSTLTNYPGGVFDLQSDAHVVGVGSFAGVFNNQGTVVKSGGSGTSTFFPPFTNAGTIEAASGELTFTGAFDNTNGSVVLAGGTLGILTGGSRGTLTIQNGTLSGSGTIDANLRNAGEIDVGGAGAPGTIVVTGDFTQTASGVLNMELGALAQGEFDQLQVAGRATLGGTLNVALLGDYVANVGDAFPVLTFGSRTQDFAAENLPDVGDPLFLMPVYDGGSLSLVTSST